MVRRFAWSYLAAYVALLAGLGYSSFARAQERGQEPAFRIVPRARSGEAVPERNKNGQTGGAQIEVLQRSPDTLLIVMRGAAVAGSEQNLPGAASIRFLLEQDFEIVATRPGVRRPRLSLTGQLIGTLQSSQPEGGAAEQGPACAAVHSAGQPILDFCIKPHGVAPCQKLFVNDQGSALDAEVLPGCYRLHQSFFIGANAPPPDHRIFPHNVPAASVLFAPDPKLETRWGYVLRTFRATPRGDFGFSVLLRVVEVPPLAAPKPLPD